jgi:hypothetical protein
MEEGGWSSRAVDQWPAEVHFGPNRQDPEMRCLALLELINCAEEWRLVVRGTEGEQRGRQPGQGGPM